MLVCSLSLSAMGSFLLFIFVSGSCYRLLHRPAETHTCGLLSSPHRELLKAPPHSATPPLASTWFPVSGYSSRHALHLIVCHRSPSLDQSLVLCKFPYSVSLTYPVHVGSPNFQNPHCPIGCSSSQLS